MFGGADRRKTLNHAMGRTTSRTPTKARFTDGISSDRKSVHTGSRASMPRASSIFRSSATQSNRDVKALFSDNVSKIYRFLVEHETDPPPEKSIRSPTGKSEFSLIFELIYQHLSKDFEIDRNAITLDSEIIPIFEGLGYPRKLKTAYFKPISSPHYYPFLLDALAWLVEVVEMSNKIAQSTQYVLSGDFHDAKSSQKPLMYSWMGTLYRDYTTDRNKYNNANYIEEKTKALREHMAREDDTDEQIGSAKEVLEQLNFECAELEADKGTEHAYQDELNKISDDLRKAKDYRRLCAAKMEQSEGKYKASCDLLSKKKEQVQSSKEEIETIKAKIEQQKMTHGISGEDVRKMNNELQTNRDLINEKRNQLEQLSRRVYLISTKNRESFSKQKESYAKLLVLIDDLSSGIELGIKPFRMPLTEQSLGDEMDRLINEFVPTFSQILNEKSLALHEQQSRISQKLENIKESVEINKEKLEMLQKLNVREERVRKGERKEWKAQRLQLEKKIEEAENEKELIVAKQKAVKQLDQDLELEEENLKKEQEICRKQNEMIDSEVREKVLLLADELTKLENERRDLLKFGDQISKTAKGLRREN